ncbi:hypothetical protein PFICI_01214 [Pestalotiopsis fici W106-1]|uniref:Uncharacterized protein n=1 Tax=Pestalotiopsis fici (strain W106-1 / CGMCC3.15140) TaxID=1229662 RepID=W3XQ60_PESFW|nr:uncharacterized protein PFICI_01214 [Pestalotiopsis fici W106-1]ETS87386.1 hypothetical protein PFICI_01214 [Pestalotiopsis fici W106-1]
MSYTQDVEILIHIAAPSRTSDDARYRSLAASYINFQSEKRTHLSELTSTPLPLSSEKIEIPNASVEHSFGDIILPSISFQASFQSVLDNANSQGRFQQPQLQAPRSLFHESQESALNPSSWHTPPSIVQDSAPENDATIALLTSPGRVLEHYLQHFAPPSQNSQTIIQKGDTQVVNEAASVISNHNDPGHERRGQPIIPCTPVSRRQTPHKPQSQEVDDEVIENTVIVFEPTTPQATRADSEPPPSKRPRRDKSDASPGALLRTASDIGLHNAPGSSTRTVTFLPRHGFGHDSLILTAPEPPVGHDTIAPDDLVTPGLAKLASDLKISKRYRPEFSTRDLRPFERGYWKIDCTDWPQDLKTEAWVFLANYIGTGVAGWGISCHRDEKFTSLRLYCWGLLAAHIYFVAYLASRRRVCFSATTWIDACGDTVIKMAKKEGVWTRY